MRNSVPSVGKNRNRKIFILPFLLKIMRTDTRRRKKYAQYDGDGKPVHPQTQNWGESNWMINDYPGARVSIVGPDGTFRRFSKEGIRAFNEQFSDLFESLREEQ